MSAKTMGTRFKRKQERKRYADEDIDDDEIEGKRLFSVEEKLASNKYNHKFAKQLKGHEVNLKWVQENGFSCPILVLDKTGLGMRVPSQNFTVNDVKQCVGSRRVLDIVDAMTQKGINMTMKEWAHYFENPESRDRILNVISLEFSHTKLQNYVEQPTIARQMDWVDIAWPRHLKERQTETTNIIEKMKYPKVQKYALMSVAGCYTDFHIDMGGTSVWYHILHGQKVFWMIPPTDENLELYEQWTLSGKQGDVFFGDKVKKCQKITLEAGYTFFIPPGWIHAVFTPKDSLVFGGNFIHSFNVPKQLRMFEVENTTHVPQKFRYPFFVEIHWYVLERYVTQLTGKQYCVKVEAEAGDGEDKTDVKSVCSKMSDSSSEQSRCRSHDEDWCSSPRSPVVDEHNYGCDTKTDIKQDDGSELDSPKPDVSWSDSKASRGSARGNKSSGDLHNNKSGKTGKNPDPSELIKPMSVKLENCLAAVSKKSWTHLTKYELEGLAVIIQWLEELPANKKRVPADITDPDGLLRDAKVMLAAHASDNTQLAVTGEPTLKWPPQKEKLKKHRLMTPKKLKVGGASGVRRRRVRCKMCEPCTRQECGECNYCKDMKKFGGPGRLKQTCTSRQCMAPVLAHSAVCYICNTADEVKQEEGDDPTPPTSLMECGICWEIVHPTCMAEKFPNLSHEGIVNEDLPSSWECPKCCDGGKQGQMKPRIVKGLPQKHTEHHPSTSGSDDSLNVKVKENQPQSPPPDVAASQERKTPERGHRRTRSNLTDTRNVLANTDVATNGHDKGDSPTKGRRRAHEDTVEKDIIPKKKVCSLEKSPLKKTAADRSSGTASPVAPPMASPVSRLTSRGRETDSDKGTCRKRPQGASSSNQGGTRPRSVSPAPFGSLSDVEGDESDDRDTGGSREKEAVPLKQPRTLVQKYAIRPAPVSPPPEYVPTTKGDRHMLERALWTRVFTELSPADLARCMAVCRTWNRWCLDSRLWRVVDLSRRRITKQHLIGVVLRQPLRLDLGWTNVSRRQLSWLVSRLPRLAHLSLAGNCWQAITALCSSSCPLLVGLDLKWAQGVRDPCIKDLLSPPLDHRPGVDDSVSRLHRCEALNLAGSDVTDASMALIVRFMPRLASLDLSYCTRVTDSGVDMLSEASSATCRSLVRVNLTGCQQLTDACLAYLSGVAQLRDLTLAGCPHITKRACLQFIENASGRRNLVMHEDRHIVSAQ